MQSIRRATKSAFILPVHWQEGGLPSFLLHGHCPHLATEFSQVNNLARQLLHFPSPISEGRGQWAEGGGQSYGNFIQHAFY